MFIGFQHIVQILVVNGAEVSSLNKYGISILDTASNATKGNLKMKEYISNTHKMLHIKSKKSNLNWPMNTNLPNKFCFLLYRGGKINSFPIP